MASLSGKMDHITEGIILMAKDKAKGNFTTQKIILPAEVYGKMEHWMDKDSTYKEANTIAVSGAKGN